MVLLRQYHFTSWKIAPGVHGVLDKIENLGEKDSMLPEYGNEQLQGLVNFYRKEAIVEFGGKTYTSPTLVNERNLC